MIATRTGGRIESIAWLNEDTGEASCVVTDGKTKWPRIVNVADMIADGGLLEIRRVANRIIEADACAV